MISMATLHEYDFELFDSPPYSINLTFSNYHLLPKIKKNTRLRTSIAVMITSYLLLTFLTKRMKASSPLGSKHYNID